MRRFLRRVPGGFLWALGIVVFLAAVFAFVHFSPEQLP
jgi:hypothetical protein